MKVPQLTFTRFVAAVLVILFHHYREAELFLNANVFVSYFYILSGFVLVVSQKHQFTAKKDFAVFYLNRFARIYPVYILALLLFVLIHQFAKWDLALHILGIQAMFPNHAINYNFPGWSISVELFFYLCFPLLVYYLFNKYTLKTILWMVFGFWLMCQIIFSFIYYSDAYAQSVQVQHFLWYNPIVHLNQFVCGGALALIFKRKHEKWAGNYDLILIILAAVIFCYLSYLKSFLNILDNKGLLVILFAPAILLLSLNNGYITKLFNHRLLVLAGEISFGMYILAEPVFDGLHKITNSLSFKVLADLRFAMLILTGISLLVYTFFEKPLQNWIKLIGIRLLNIKKLSANNKSKAAPELISKL